MIFEFDRIRVGTRLNRVASSRGVRGFREILFLLMLTGCAETGSDVAHLDPSELAEEVHAALAEPIRLDGYARLMPALQQLGPENVDAVSEVYTELFRGLGEPELRPFLDAWVAFDPAAALAYAERQPVALATKQAYAAVIYSWATREPIRAREVALEIIGESAYLTEAVTHALIRGWAMSDQDGLVKYVASSSDDPGYMAHIAAPQIYLRSGAEGLFEWTDQLIESTAGYAPRMKAFRFAVRTVGFRNPQAAIPYINAHRGADYAKDGPRALLEVWIEQDHETALEWLRTGAPEASRAEALHMAFGSWLAHDPTEARSWIEAVPATDPFYQPAFSSFAKRLAKIDPIKALEWCRRGQLDVGHRDCLLPVATTWYRKDPVAAGRWLERESGLDVADRIGVRRRGANGVRNQNSAAISD